MNKVEVPENSLRANQIIKRVWLVCTMGLGAMCLFIAWLSLGWRMDHDTPNVLYFGYLVDRLGRIPYTEVFETNPPGVFLLGVFMGRICDYRSDVALRYLDLTCLALLLICSYSWMRRVGRRQAIFGCTLFAYAYFTLMGDQDALERDYFVTIGLVISLFLLFGLPAGFNHLKAAIVGVIFGLDALIKPQVVFLLPWIALFHIIETSNPPNWRQLLTRRTLTIGLAYAVGVLLPVGLAGIYLYVTGALPKFLEIVQGYWPLYTAVNGKHGRLPFSRKVLYIGKRCFTMNPMYFWLPIGFLGLSSTLLWGKIDSAQRRMIIFLTGLAAISVAYVAIIGKFFGYHWIPFLYFFCQIVALNFTTPRESTRKALQYLPCFCLAFSIVFLGDFYDKFIGDFKDSRPRRTKTVVRADEMYQYLEHHLKDGDTVQPMDWTNGSVHSMLLSRAPIATRFYGDFMFCHDISNPLIQSFRREFSETMGRVKPRFLLFIPGNRPTGYDCDNITTALIPNFTTAYKIAYAKSVYKIFERVDPETSSTQSVR